MKSKHKKRYLEALTDLASQMAVGASVPVVVDSYRFFSDACERADIPQPFTPDDRRRINRSFTSGFTRMAAGLDPPVRILPVAAYVLGVCGHGKQAVIDDNRTPFEYREAAKSRDGNAYECWAICGETTNMEHPMFHGPLETERQRIVSSAVSHGERARLVGATPALAHSGGNGTLALPCNE